MQQREVLLLAEMIDAAEEARRLVADRDLVALETDRQTRDALLWNFTVLGEAAAQLPDPFTPRFPSVDGARPSQLRNRIVHGYWSIDLSILHTTAVHDLPPFAPQLHQLLSTLAQ